MIALKRETLRALVLASVALAAVLACNSAVDDPSQSDTMLQVATITAVSSDPTATTVSDSTTLTVKGVSRSGSSSSLFGDVTLTRYEVSWPGLTTPFSAALGAVVPVGGSTALSLVVVPASAKSGALTGTVTASIHLDGKDLSDKPVSLDTSTPITFTTTPDSDGDGVPDTTDNCPLVFNPSQLDTFPLTPNGVGDCCDPTTPGYPVCSP